jgi:hypothetical protein
VREQLTRPLREAFSGHVRRTIEPPVEKALGAQIVVVPGSSMERAAAQREGAAAAAHVAAVAAISQ